MQPAGIESRPSMEPLSMAMEALSMAAQPLTLPGVLPIHQTPPRLLPFERVSGAPSPPALHATYGSPFLVTATLKSLYPDAPVQILRNPDGGIDGRMSRLGMLMPGCLVASRFSAPGPRSAPTATLATNYSGPVIYSYGCDTRNLDGSPIAGPPGNTPIANLRGFQAQYDDGKRGPGHFIFTPTNRSPPAKRTKQPYITPRGYYVTTPLTPN
jgi:hypothetical protein